MCSKEVDNKSDKVSKDTTGESKDVNKLGTSLDISSSDKQDTLAQEKSSTQADLKDSSLAGSDVSKAQQEELPVQSYRPNNQPPVFLQSKELPATEDSTKDVTQSDSDGDTTMFEAGGAEDKPKELKHQELPVYPADSPSYEELCVKAKEGDISKYELIMLLDKSPGALPRPVIMPPPRTAPSKQKLTARPMVPPLNPTYMTITSWNEDQREKEIERDKLARGIMEPPQPMSVATSLFARKQLWVRCEGCGAVLYISHLYKYNYTCKDCEDNVRISSFDRISQLIDPDSWRPMFELVSATNPLNFHDKKPYTERLKEAQKRTEIQDAVQTGTGLLGGVPVALGVLAFDFMAGTMGSVVGEKITRLIEHATETGIMLILVSASGGARMQEGALSLVQMAKISGALFNYQNCCKNFYVSVLSSPTTGGVTASFAMLGDIVIAEPKATIGFAGRRVIEQTLGEILPDEFQTAEYLMDHGIVDLIIARNFLKGILLHLCNMSAAAPFRRPGRQFPGHLS